MQRSLSVTLAFVLAAAWTAPALSHCEIPCGIYGDKMRFDVVEEHIATIEKSMNQIAALSGAGEKNYNQIVRWVTNKDEHAGQIQHIASQYFLAQRIKPVDSSSGDEHAKYTKHLALLHQMIVSAMKCKQTTDLAHVEKLRALNKEFRASYLGPEGEARAH
jgi:nickel superoxide dismutase